MNALGYCRISKLDGQREVSVSVELQEEKIRAYCVTRDLALLEPVYQDVDVSGGVPMGERPAGCALGERVRAGGVAAVVVLKLDRLFRDAADCLQTIREWDRYGVALHVVDLGGNSICTTTAGGRFMLTVLAGAAEMERNLIRERTAAALAHKKRKGEKCGGYVPYGYEQYEAGGVKMLRELPVEKAQVDYMVGLKRGGANAREIAGQLNERRVPTRLNHGAGWTTRQVGRVLKRELARVAAETKEERCPFSTASAMTM